MRTYVMSYLDDAALLRHLAALVSQERGTLAAVIACLAEIDARRLYLPAGYPSMYEYCLQELRWSEQTSLKRLRAARAARRFPVIFDALAEGRLHLTAVVLLAPHLTSENVDELLAAAAHRTAAEIEQLLAGRFPKPDVPERLEAIAPPAVSPMLLSVRTVQTFGDTDSQRRADPVPAQGPQLAPLAPERFALQFTIGKDTYDKLRYVQGLLSHQSPTSDVAQLFDRALDALTKQLEKQKFAATAKPQPCPRTHRSSANPRYVPARVKRAVWERDGGRCTFVNAAGQRCRGRSMLEFDHVDPVACGGQATVEGVRILCRGHNQYEAERRFGAGFMSEKRDKSRRSAADAHARVTTARKSVPTPAHAHAPTTATVTHASTVATMIDPPPAATMTPATRAHAQSPAQEDVTRDVMAVLRALGFRVGEARRAVEHCERLRGVTGFTDIRGVTDIADVTCVTDVTIEERVRDALRFLCPNPGSSRRAHSPT